MPSHIAPQDLMRQSYPFFFHQNKMNRNIEEAGVVSNWELYKDFGKDAACRS